MPINSKNTVFPLESNYLNQCLLNWEIDLDHISIRELNRIVDEISAQYNVEFLRFEFGIPGLIPNAIAPKEEIKILTDNPKIPATYPPFDGIPRLKEATAQFVKKFLNNKDTIITINDKLRKTHIQ